MSYNLYREVITTDIIMPINMKTDGVDLTEEWLTQSFICDCDNNFTTCFNMFYITRNNKYPSYFRVSLWLLDQSHNNSQNIPSSKLKQVLTNHLSVQTRAHYTRIICIRHVNPLILTVILFRIYRRIHYWQPQIGHPKSSLFSTVATTQ